MGKFANTFDMKLAGLKADVETKIGVFFIKNPKLEKVEFEKPYAGLIKFTARIVHDRNRNYIELSNTQYGTSDMREVFSIDQMIAFLEEIEDILGQDI